VKSALGSASALLGACGLGLWLLYANTLGGMGRDVGGDWLLTGYTFCCLFLWPAVLSLPSYRLAHGSPRARHLRLFGYGSAPLLYLGIAYWAPREAWERLELQDVWFNYFGEVLVFHQIVKSAVFTAITVAIVELCLARGRRAEDTAPAR
jgi:hypothetical protein